MKSIELISEDRGVYSFCRKPDNRYAYVHALSETEAWLMAVSAYAEHDDAPDWCRYTPLGHRRDGMEVVLIDYDKCRVTWQVLR